MASARRKVAEEMRERSEVVLATLLDVINYLEA